MVTTMVTLNLASTFPCKPFMGEGYDEGDARKRNCAGGTPALPG